VILRSWQTPTLVGVIVIAGCGDDANKSPVLERESG